MQNFSTAPSEETSSGEDHIPVLVDEVLHYLTARPEHTIVDGTLGGAGHSRILIEQLSHTGTFIGFDVDHFAIERATTALSDAACKVVLIEDSFSHMENVLQGQDLLPVDRILLDLGWSSYQFNDDARGFSFQLEGPLDMRLGTGATASQLTAYDLIHQLRADQLMHIISAYGEERSARKIAEAIVEERKIQPLSTTTALAALIERTLGGRGKSHPATRTFQALRIAVNDELGALEKFLEQIPGLLAPGGRVGIISFHSLEDRIVKIGFKKIAKDGGYTILTKKPIVPTREEVITNRRARSAKFRVLERDS
ncbi:MAG: 16S rRNA (cytosine1402-N4)-methyltransferase [Planctomycetota bacterium]|jgi:16S rRNA (cytosine1402-N4)-methyltransferase